MRGIPRFDSLERRHLELSAGAVAVSLVLASPAFAGSLALGAALEALNVRGLLRSARHLLGVGGAARRAGFLGARFVLLAAAIGVALWAGAHPLGLVLGLSLAMPAAVIEAWRQRPAVDPDARPLPPDDPAWEQWNPWLARPRAPREEDEDEDQPAGAEGAA